MHQPQPTRAQIAEQIEKEAEEVAARVVRGDERFRTIEGKLDRLLDAVECIPDMQSDLADVKKDAAATKEIVEAWAAVKTMGKFLKWSAGIIGAVSAIIVALKISAAHFLR